MTKNWPKPTLPHEQFDVNGPHWPVAPGLVRHSIEFLSNHLRLILKTSSLNSMQSVHHRAWPPRGVLQALLLNLPLDEVADCSIVLNLKQTFRSTANRSQLTFWFSSCEYSGPPSSVWNGGPMERTDKAQIDQVAQEGTDVVRDLEDDVTWSASQTKQLTLRSAKPTRWQRADQIWRRLYLLHFHDTIRVTLSLFHVHMHSFHFDLIEKSSRNRRATSLTRADAPPSQLKSFWEACFNAHDVWWGTEATALNRGLQRRAVAETGVGRRTPMILCHQMCGSKHWSSQWGSSSFRVRYPIDIRRPLRSFSLAVAAVWAVADSIADVTSWAFRLRHCPRSPGTQRSSIHTSLHLHTDVLRGLSRSRSA